MKTTYPKLPKKFKEKWLKALRSGGYEQGRTVLHSNKDNTYCCLGVACDISGIDNETMDRNTSIPSNSDFKNVPYIITSSHVSNISNELIGKNDGMGKYIRPLSFKQIANWIECNL